MGIGAGSRQLQGKPLRSWFCSVLSGDRAPLLLAGVFRANDAPSQTDPPHLLPSSIGVIIEAPTQDSGSLLLGHDQPCGAVFSLKGITSPGTGSAGKCWSPASQAKAC